MNEVKTNTVLLSVIGIATLLIAVVGATFAFFTAQLSGNTGETTINLGAGILTISYSGDSAELHPMSDQIHPQPAEEGLPFGVPVITKTFSLTGDNTTNSVMPYTLAMVVSNNTFTTGALRYTLTVDAGEGNTAAPITYEDNQGITTTVGAPGLIVHDFCGGELPVCSFVGRVDGEVHSYTLRIYFPSDEVHGNDEDRGKTFSGRVRVGVEAAYIT